MGLELQDRVLCGNITGSSVRVPRLHIRVPAFDVEERSQLHTKFLLVLLTHEDLGCEQAPRNRKRLPTARQRLVGIYLDTNIGIVYSSLSTVIVHLIYEARGSKYSKSTSMVISITRYNLAAWFQAIWQSLSSYRRTRSPSTRPHVGLSRIKYIHTQRLSRMAIRSTLRFIRILYHMLIALQHFSDVVK